MNPSRKSEIGMGEVVRLPEISKEREKARLIQEARALYESVFPSEKRPEMMPSRPRPDR